MDPLRRAALSATPCRFCRVAKPRHRDWAYQSGAGRLGSGRSAAAQPPTPGGVGARYRADQAGGCRSAVQLNAGRVGGCTPHAIGAPAASRQASARCGQPGRGRLPGRAVRSGQVRSGQVATVRAVTADCGGGQTVTGRRRLTVGHGVTLCRCGRPRRFRRQRVRV